LSVKRSKFLGLNVKLLWNLNKGEKIYFGKIVVINDITIMFSTTS